jgi:cellulose biosynthesis protein BcsQ
MQSIAFFNNKGGVGKTTLLCNVAAFLAGQMKQKILVVDADPQCNATQLMLDEREVFDLYDSAKSFTIHSIIHPLSLGKGYSEKLEPLIVDAYEAHLVPGDPRLALKEDLLSKDWQDAVGGDIRGLRTSFLFSQFLTQCSNYDFVLFDMGPSLGSINRSVLLACDFFVSPMSIDIFSLKAIENISTALLEWRKKLSNGLAQVDVSLKDDVPSTANFRIQFAGYVAQQYIQRTTLSGDGKEKEKRAVLAYENIMRRIPKSINTNFVERLGSIKIKYKYEIGTIPNLYSLIPMSQTAHKPIFSLRAKDGVRGAHFNKVRDAEEIFRGVATRLIENVRELSK